jgi:hypothetical protein
LFRGDDAEMSSTVLRFGTREAYLDRSTIDHRLVHDGVHAIVAAMWPVFFRLQCTNPALDSTPSAKTT